MAWTKRAEIKDNYQDIVKYLGSMAGFHDYRIGAIQYDGNSVNIFVEEVVPGKKVKDNDGLVWDFHFEKVNAFFFNVDCAIGFYVQEIEQGDVPGEISFNLVSGTISIIAEKVTLGIPSQET